MAAPKLSTGAASIMTLLQTITITTIFFLATLLAGTNVSPVSGRVEIHEQTRHRWGTRPAKAAVFATSYVGTPYVWGGTTPHGFDCSGLVQYAYKMAGVELPRTALSQQAATLPVSAGDLRQGDLVFFRRKRGLHVGIYLSNGRFIHAPSPGKRVMLSNLNTPYWQNRYKGGGRILVN